MRITTENSNKDDDETTSLSSQTQSTNTSEKSTAHSLEKDLFDVSSSAAQTSHDGSVTTLSNTPSLSDIDSVTNVSVYDRTRMVHEDNLAMQSSVRRELYIAYTLPPSHNHSISMLKIVSNPGATQQGSNNLTTAMSGMIPGKQREMVDKSNNASSSYELLVGDERGNVSRWGSTHLDTLLQQGKVQTVLEREGHD